MATVSVQLPIEEIKRQYNKMRYEVYNKTKYNEDPEFRKRTSEYNSNWQKQKMRNDPEYRQRQLDRMKNRWLNDPEHRERVKQRNKERYAQKKEMERLQKEMERAKIETP